MYRARMEFVDVGRGSVAADVYGPDDGTPVLLIAGGGADASSWVRLVPEVAYTTDDLIRSEPIDSPLTLGHRVAVFDQAGTGRSADVAPATSTAEYARDALEVANALLEAPFVVVGMSLGGMAAQHLALMSPRSVSGLVLVATIPSASSFVPSTTPVEVSADRRPFSRRFPDEEPELFAHATDRAQSIRYHADAQLAQISLFLSHDPAEALSAIACPTVVVCGGEDTTFPLDNSRVLARLVPGARLVELDGVGHAVHIEAPAAIVDAVMAVPRSQ